jgi:hypothetical protein
MIEANSRPRPEATERRVWIPVPAWGDNARVDPARKITADGARPPWPVRRCRAVVIGAIAAYALLAAVCHPLTGSALVAVFVTGIPLCWLGVRRRPRHAESVDRRSAVAWLGLGGLAAAFELGLWLGPDDATHPTLSTLADPVLSTYPGRVLGYLLWIGSGAWLVTR